MNHDEIHKICRDCGIKKYTINGDGSVDVNEGVFLTNCGLNKLLLNFGTVKGNFHCDANKLTSLVGSPKKVIGTFWCNGNKLTSLKGSPLEVGGSFICSFNKLTSLKGAPKKVGGIFLCNNNSVELNYEKYLKSIKRIDKLKQLT